MDVLKEHIVSVMGDFLECWNLKTQAVRSFKTSLSSTSPHGATSEETGSFKIHLHNSTDYIFFTRTKKLPDADKTFSVFSNNFYRSTSSLFLEHVVTFRGLP